MTEKKLNPEEQKLKARRTLLKLAAYSIPAIATFLTSKEGYADGGDEGGGGGDEGGGGGDEGGGGEGERTKRRIPNGPKRYKSGLS